jgi:hypothetical protein
MPHSTLTLLIDSHLVAKANVKVRHAFLELSETAKYLAMRAALGM